METGHISALREKHAALEHRIESEGRRPMPDTALITRLKKKKLLLKEEIKAEQLPA